MALAAEAEKETSLILDIEGMTCAACASRVERAIASTPGVRSSTVNLALERANVVVDTGADPATILQAIDDAGYTGALRAKGEDLAAREAERETRARDEARRDTVHFLFSTALALPLVAPMLLIPFGLDLHPAPLWQWLLATPVQFYAGGRFYVGAYRALKGGGANMDVLVALGTSAAYGLSAIMTLRYGAHAHDHLYFEGGAVVIVALLAGKLLEARAKGGTAAAVRALLKLQPPIAHEMRNGQESDVPIAALNVGALIAVRPGELIPVDGMVREGLSEVNEALLTGESAAVGKKEGARVIGGTLNGSGRLIIEASAIGEDSVLARMSRAVERAQNARPPVQGLVDRITAIFVPAVLGLAALTLVGWLVATGNSEEAIVNAVSVLVIACPCALGLATPAAIVAGIGAAAKAGILLREPTVIEQASAIDTVVFDKTGTLTEGRLRLVAQTIFPAAGSEAGRDEVLRLVASAQAPSEHAIARAVIAAAQAKGLALAKTTAFEAVPGEGIRATVEGRAIRAGTAAFLAGSGIDTALLEPQASLIAGRGETAVLISIDGRFAGTFGFVDAPRATSREAVAGLKARNKHVVLLSGDRDEVAQAIGKIVGVDEAKGGADPRRKAGFIASLRQQGRHVAMVGDGVNDALSLAAADIGIAMGSGSDVAIEAADIALMRDEPRLVAAALEIAAKTQRKVRQNLLFAFAYNVLGIPLAMAGLLSPGFAGAAMAMSSVSVLTSALLLTRWRPDFAAK